MNRKTILYICSWLDHRDVVGSFFIEQGELFQDDYNVIFLNFKKCSIRNLFRLKSLFNIDYSFTDKGSLVIYASYPYFIKFGFSVLSSFQKIIVWLVSISLNKKGITVDLIHAQSLLDAGVFSFYFNKFYKIPYIVTEHNQISFLKKRIYDYLFVKSVLDAAKIKLVVSNAKIQQFASNDLFYDFKVVGNLVDDSVFNYSKLKQSRILPLEKNFRIVSIGAFSQIKDQETLFRALKLLDPNVQNVDFIWVGPCSWGDVKMQQVERFYHRFDLKNISVSILPQATREEVGDILMFADVFVLSSLVEGFPVSVLEALASGVPVVSSMCGGVEAVIHEHNGRLFPIRDFEKLANLLLLIFNGNLVFDKKVISEEVISKYGKESFRRSLDPFYQTLL